MMIVSDDRWQQITSPKIERALTAVWISILLTSMALVVLPRTSYAQERIADVIDQSSLFLSLEESEKLAESGFDRVTDVSQLSDVSSSDWAFQELESLVERYNCLQGYPNRLFLGFHTLSRYEFAAGLNACLEHIDTILATASKDAVNTQDLEAIEQLQRIFKAELAGLNSRIASLESRTQVLEAQQFSTTTKLFGQVVMGVQGRTANQADFFPVDGQRDLQDPGTNINVITNAQISLVTQFSPRSLLFTGLQVGTGSTVPRLSNDVRLGYEGDTNGIVQLSDLTYRQLIGDRLAVIVGTAGVSPVNVFRGTNRIESAGFGPLSAFAQRNPIINIGSGRGGIGFDWQIDTNIALQGVYATTFPELSTVGGLFGGDAGGIVLGTQLNVGFSNSFDMAVNYLYAYTPQTSFAGRLGTGIGDDQVTVNASLNTHAVGGTLSWRASPSVTVGGWVGYTTSSIPNSSGSVETLNWMGFLNFPDLFGRGNLGGIYVGQPPRIMQSNLPVGNNIPDLLAGGTGVPGGQPGTTIHTEAFYRYRISDRITISPGVVVIFSPAHTPTSDTIVIGAIRTTFSF